VDLASERRVLAVKHGILKEKCRIFREIRAAFLLKRRVVREKRAVFLSGRAVSRLERRVFL
jgi:hypothetical protein